jgi:hypothetical protein
MACGSKEPPGRSSGRCGTLQLARWRRMACQQPSVLGSLDRIGPTETIRTQNTLPRTPDTHAKATFISLDALIVIILKGAKLRSQRVFRRTGKCPAQSGDCVAEWRPPCLYTGSSEAINWFSTRGEWRRSTLICRHVFHRLLMAH